MLPQCPPSGEYTHHLHPPLVHAVCAGMLTHTCMQIVNDEVSKLNSQWENKTCSLREWRDGSAAFSSAWAKKVTVAPSNVAGLGVFTTTAVKQGETVCIYSGQMIKCVEGNKSKYLLQAKWWNKETKEHEVWFIDAADKRSAVGRYINDACDTYPDGGSWHPSTRPNTSPTWATGKCSSSCAEHTYISMFRHACHSSQCLFMYACMQVRHHTRGTPCVGILLGGVRS